MWWRLSETTRRYGEREALILRTAHNCGSNYEWGIHAPKAPEVAISAEELAIIAGENDASGSEHAWLRTLLNLADELHTTADVSDATWAALTERLDDSQALTRLILVGQYHMLAYALNGARVQADPQP